MTVITDELVIRGNHIKNRIVMSPMVTFSFHGDNGSYYGKQHIEHYTKRAKGGSGLIIVQATSVFGAVDSTGMWSAGDIAALKQIATNCHEYGAMIMMQLHCGNMDINELSAEEIHSMQMNMKQAALRACEMGFDGVEYHFAHGFTLCKFLDASYNRRTDQYGGDALNRARVLTQVLPDIRNNTHKNFIVSVRMGEYLPESEDGIEAAKTFEKAGIDLLHISFGMQPPTNPVPDGFICSPMTYSGCKIKKEVKIPVIAVNEIRTEEQVRFLIENNYVDLVAVGRGMLADPDFANHVINSEPVNMCLGCERCFWFTDDTLCPAGKDE
ncbi:MAG TPA: NADH:flavin oxidoreductase [Methanosarcina sp.]|nr:NADH:flavin oxidoreductase [Methanosarcina sp.]